ncbi:MAG: alpha-ketoglutarate-dependent dioxygenase AlkB [Bacteroidetes bacterium]|nr:alpha-ketoglutarate-dependent dioxygenase AlkB [Bacteroidota bacterium]MDA0950159.1 alpha-ketoglutarate-dependent dioxygenase AlkB [Bacteroidota bacterium]
MIDLSIGSATLHYWPDFLSPDRADYYFKRFYTDSPWRSEKVTVFGKVYDQPRLTALYSNSPRSYSYSGLTLDSHPFHPELSALKEQLEKQVGYSFNSCLFNLYRDENDSNGWHADDEKELGELPVIASLSLGESRLFHLKHKTDKTLKRSIALEHGSLLLMAGKTQKEFKHQLPKTKKPKTARINLTFRYIFEAL